MKKKLVFLLFFAAHNLTAQVLTNFNTRYNDAFVDWEIFTDSLDDHTGNLTMTWQNPDDWSQWTYRIGEQSGSIKTKWARDFESWEVRGDNKIVSVQTIFRGDVRQWRITDNNFSLELTCRDGLRCDEWSVDDAKRGQIQIFTNLRGDPRNWNVDDQLDPSVSLPMKMALVFIAILNSIPKH